MHKPRGARLCSAVLRVVVRLPAADVQLLCRLLNEARVFLRLDWQPAWRLRPKRLFKRPIWSGSQSAWHQHSKLLSAPYSHNQLREAGINNNTVQD